MPTRTVRSALVPGIGLTVAGVLLVLLTPVLDLALEATLVGAALGAALALIPDRAPIVRLGSFLLGLLLAWVGFVVRAAVLPDTTTGRAVATGLVLLVCTGIAVASMDRLPLWGLLVGAGAFAGTYEVTYSAAPPEVTTTSVAIATSLLVAVAAGFLVAIALSPVRRADSDGDAATTSGASATGHTAMPGQRDAVATDNTTPATVSIMEKNR